MKNDNRNMLELVGHLQVIDQPLLSLYVSQSGDALFFFYRLRINEFYLTEVSANEVIEYLDERLGLVEIFSESKDYLYHHRSKRYARTSDFVPVDGDRRSALQIEMKVFDKYDDVFGLDEIKVRHYLQDRHLSKDKESHKEYAYG